MHMFAMTMRGYFDALVRVFEQTPDVSSYTIG